MWDFIASLNVLRPCKLNLNTLIWENSALDPVESDEYIAICGEGRRFESELNVHLNVRFALSTGHFR